MMIIVKNKLITMKIASTKERLIQYIENHNIKIKKFYEQTRIKRGFLDSDKLKSAVSDRFLAIIINFPDINLEWLITGKGEMLKKYETNKGISILAEKSEVYGVVNYKEKYFETLEKLNQANERLLALTDIGKELIEKK